MPRGGRARERLCQQAGSGRIHGEKEGRWMNMQDCCSIKLELVTLSSDAEWDLQKKLFHNHNFTSPQDLYYMVILETVRKLHSGRWERFRKILKGDWLFSLPNLRASWSDSSTASFGKASYWLEGAMWAAALNAALSKPSRRRRETPFLGVLCSLKGSSSFLFLLHTNFGRSPHLLLLLLKRSWLVWRFSNDLDTKLSRWRCKSFRF